MVPISAGFPIAPETPNPGYCLRGFSMPVRCMTTIRLNYGPPGNNWLIKMCREVYLR
jgi:hypothetical protein